MDRRLHHSLQLAIVLACALATLGCDDDGADSPTDATSDGTADDASTDPDIATTGSDTTTTETDDTSSTTDASPPGDTASPDLTASDTSPPTDADTVEPDWQHHLYTAEVDGTITAWSIDDTTGALTNLGALEAGERVSFLAFARGERWLYATQGTSIAGYDTNAWVPSPNGATDAGNNTHLEVDHSDRWVFAASYGGNRLSVAPLGTDGVPGEVAATFGGGNDTVFCENAHQVRVSPDNQHLYVPCLGSDHVRIMSLNSDTGEVVDLGTASTAQGAGPRHLDFHPALDVLYVLNELDSTVVVFDRDPTTGGLTERQTLSNVPAGANASRSSDIHVSPDGRFVYAVNREPENSIAIYAVDPTDGTLSAQGHVSTGGFHARTFTIHPDGEWLWVGHSDTTNVVTFDVNTATGELVQVADDADTFDDHVYFVGVLRTLAE